MQSSVLRTRGGGDFGVLVDRSICASVLARQTAVLINETRSVGELIINYTHKFKVF